MELEVTADVGLAEAQANLRAVGCVPGRVIRIHDPTHSPGVLGADVNGLLAFSAPRGTVIDLLLNEWPRRRPGSSRARRAR